MSMKNGCYILGIFQLVGRISTINKFHEVGNPARSPGTNFKPVIQRPLWGPPFVKSPGSTQRTIDFQGRTRGLRFRKGTCNSIVVWQVERKHMYNVLI